MSHSKLYKLIFFFVLNKWAVAIANSAPQLAVYPPILLGGAPCPNQKGSIMWQSDSKNVRKVLDKLRKMTRYERIIIRSWLNDWYYYQKQQEDEE